MSEPLVERVLSGDRGALARLIRLIDDRDPAGAAALPAAWRAAAGSRITGVTGAPGSGKSTLADRLVGVMRARNERVGVVAVDPSSPFTGGAILGDRVRMQQHAADDGVFIRSLATRGHLGGLSASARDVLAALAAGGFRSLLLETVGVGQDEVEVARVADTVLLVVAPGAGDAIQTLKAGVMEIADIFVVNKSDRPGAHETAREIEMMLATGESTRPDSWTPPVVLTCASEGAGIADLDAAITRHAAHLGASERGAERLRERSRVALLDRLRIALDAEVDRRFDRRIDEAAGRIAAGASDPHSEAAALLEDLLGKGP